MTRETASADGENAQVARSDAVPPARLGLQTGRLDDHRAYITPGHACWQSACERFLDRDQPRDDSLVGAADAAMDSLCARWPPRSDHPPRVEALAVTVELAAQYAGRERILAALATPRVPAERLAQELALAPAVGNTWAPPRPRFPYIYDADTESRAPVVAILDGPRCPRVAVIMDTIKRHDENLAAAIVLGADLDMLDLLDRIGLDASRASRQALADKVERDKREWIHRADAARSRQRLEGGYYGWCSDNLPPGCIEAARGEVAYYARASLPHEHDSAS